MAVDTNAVAVFYADGKYKLRDWTVGSMLELQDQREVLGVIVYHAQTPGSLPNATQFSGLDQYACRGVDGGVIIRQMSYPPTGPGAKLERYFSDDGAIQSANTLPNISIGAAVGGMQAVFQVLDHNDPMFDDLDTRMGNKRNDLRSSPVPEDGTY